MSESSAAAKEFKAIAAVHDALKPLEPSSRERVLGYIASLLGIVTQVAKPGSKKEYEAESTDEEDAAADAAAKGARTYGTFAELYAAASPKNNGEKALVAGYWLQVCQEAESFTAAVAQRELTHLGHAVANITDAFDSVKDQKPSLILQLKKSGNSRQARKLYKVSHEGVRKVEALIGG